MLRINTRKIIPENVFIKSGNFRLNGLTVSNLNPVLKAVYANENKKRMSIVMVTFAILTERKILKCFVHFAHFDQSFKRLIYISKTFLVQSLINDTSRTSVSRFTNFNKNIRQPIKNEELNNHSDNPASLYYYTTKNHNFARRSKIFRGVFRTLSKIDDFLTEVALPWCFYKKVL